VRAKSDAQRVHAAARVVDARHDRVGEETVALLQQVRQVAVIDRDAIARRGRRCDGGAGPGGREQPFEPLVIKRQEVQLFVELEPRLTLFHQLLSQPCYLLLERGKRRCVEEQRHQTREQAKAVAPEILY
jgi:hypothetical protein